MRFLRRAAAVEAEGGVDLTPVIDMTFLLLIFFMVSTTFVKDMKVDIERPGAASAQSASTEAIRIYMERNGALTLDGNPLKPWMVQSRVRERVQAGLSRSVLLITDRLVPAERLIEVVDQCRLGGAVDIGVATEKEVE